LLAFEQPFFCFPPFDSCEVGSHVFAAVQIVLRQLLIFFACPSFEFATFITELEVLAVQALNDLASASPALRRESHAAFASNLFGRAFEALCPLFQIFSIVLVCSIDGARSAVQSASANQVLVHQAFSSLLEREKGILSLKRLKPATVGIIPAFVANA
jgi:hypothetical protein